MSMHTIDQAKNMRNGINLEGEVVRKGETRTVSKKTGGTIDVCDAYLKDSANEEIKITLWAEDIEKISQGAKIKITNGYTSSFKGEISIGKGKFGSKYKQSFRVICRAKKQKKNNTQ